MLEVYEFDVALSDHPLKDNPWHALYNIAILAENHTEAFYTAYAMAARHGVVTEIWDRI